MWAGEHVPDARIGGNLPPTGHGCGQMPCRHFRCRHEGCAVGLLYTLSFRLARTLNGEPETGRLHRQAEGNSPLPGETGQHRCERLASLYQASQGFARRSALTVMPMQVGVHDSGGCRLRGRGCSLRRDDSEAGTAVPVVKPTVIHHQSHEIRPVALGWTKTKLLAGGPDAASLSYGRFATHHAARPPVGIFYTLP